MQPDPSDRQPTDTPPPADTIESLRERLAHSNSELDKVRKEAAGYRTGSRGRLAEATRYIAGLLGDQIAPDAEPNLDDLKPRLETALKADTIKKLQGENRELKIGKGLAEAFHRAGVKPSLTRAYLRESGGMDRINKLDPDSDTFAEDLDLHIGEAVENEPALRGEGRAPIRTTAPMRPPPSDTQLGLEEVSQLSPEAVTEALKSGKLDSLLGRRS